jgi:hypothetical protein
MSHFMTVLRGKRPPRPDPRQHPVGSDLSLKTELDRLRAGHSGMAFIYSAMDLFVAHFELSDLIVVFTDSHEETQIFRWGAKPISPDRISLVDAAPGVYCYPLLNDAADVDLLFEMCQQVFADLLARGGASSNDKSLDSLRGEEPSRADESDGSANFGAEDPQVAGSQFGVETWRVFTSKLFVYIAVANIVLALLNVAGSVRFVLGLILGLAIPGWSVVGLIHLRDTALEIALSIAASIAIVMMGAQLLITVHWWHLEAFEIFLCLACLPSLVHQAKWHWTPLRRRR